MLSIFVQIALTAATYSALVSAAAVVVSAAAVLAVSPLLPQPTSTPAERVTAASPAAIRFIPRMWGPPLGVGGAL